MSARKRRLRLILTALTLIALGAMVFILRHQVFETIANLGRVNAWALALMIPLQALNYHSYALLYQSLLGVLGEKFRYRSLYRVVLELNFVNSVFPSGGVSGFSYFGLRMKPEGVKPGKAGIVHMMRFGLVFISYQILMFLGVVMLALGGHANRITILAAASLSTALLILTLGIAFISNSEKRINNFIKYITNVLNRIIHLFRSNYPETINIAKTQAVFTEFHENYNVLKANYKKLLRPLLLALSANITEVATIYVVYIAFGRLVNPGAVIIAYAIASLAGFISVLPGGVGVYEGLMTAVLASAGVTPGLSIPVTVMYRVLNSLLQLPPGYYFYNKTLRAKTAHSHEQ